jgi:hypothetical protein
LARSVSAALQAAFAASLANDRDIAKCLNEANYGTVALIFRSCLSSSGSSSDAATAAKQQFLSLYNQLRQNIGEPSTTQSF